MSLPEPYTPKELDALTLAFPASVSDLMPTYTDIPEDFRSWTPKTEEAAKWIEFQRTWFYSGLVDAVFFPKEGVDNHTAVLHLSAIQASFEPKHEHKMAAVAYLASLWFEDIQYNKFDNEKEGVMK